jgi:hypothetical protein
VIDSIINLLFRCPHRRLTRPVTPVSKEGAPHGDTYVVCLDCGKQFSYDLKEMRIGKPLPTSAGTGVLPPGMPEPHRSKVKLAVMASVLPLGIAIGSALTSRRQRTAPSPELEPDKPAKPEVEGSGSPSPEDHKEP